MSELRKNEEIFSLIEKNKSKQVVLYGAASRGVRALYNLIDKGFPRERIIFCDSNPRLWNTELYGFPIISLQELEKLLSQSPLEKINKNEEIKESQQIQFLKQSSKVLHDIVSDFGNNSDAAS